jgi:[glutamine synthetase] adenylyltransferase / [glutamine synthetase]-adenylyl-L-tyrosine phosphorylase
LLNSRHTLAKKPHNDEAEAPTRLPHSQPDAAVPSMDRVRARLDAPAYQALQHILKELPDPDASIVMLARLLDAPRSDARQRLATDPNLLHYVCLVFAHSAWLGEVLIRDPDLLRRIGSVADLGRCWSCEDFREEFARYQAHSTASELSESLSRFRKREYVRILLRDVLGIAQIGEITEEISALSDALLQEAVTAVSTELIRRFGRPRWVDPAGRYRDSRFAVVSLGKLGGNELNYSSDVDLLFLYEGGKEPAEMEVSNREFFIALAQKTTDLLASRTREGQVFRIDLRLRPQGHEGELAVALPRALQYYSVIAQDWELQAMIKARHSAGDASLTREFIRAIEPFVYRPNVNFAAVKTALQTRERIDRRGRDRLHRDVAGRAINVKLDRGGIRDIEFLVQCLQRVYGGEETWLQSRGTLHALQKLHDKQYISGNDFHLLGKAYEFLRDIEHRLQLRHGRQSHQLPANLAELTVLGKCVSRGEFQLNSAREFMTRVVACMAAVADIYRRTIYREKDSELSSQDNDSRQPMQLSTTQERVLGPTSRRLAIDAPELLAKLSAAEISPHAMRNVNRFLNSAATSVERYDAVVRAAGGIALALQIFECSEYLSEILIRHPADVQRLSEFTNSRESQASSTVPMKGSRLASEPSSPSGPEHAQVAIRIQFRREMLALNARDLLSPREIWEVLADNSSAADRAITGALALAGAPSGLAIFALGRLGSREFDVLSDADLLFVADDSADLDECRRAAQRAMEFLAAYTREGSVFPVDARLRPHGSVGDLVTTPLRLTAYFSTEAKPWEAISYLRMRLVAGDEQVGQQALQWVRDGSLAAAGQPEFFEKLRAMRLRLESSDVVPSFKTGVGGIYDIDFLAGRMQVERGLWSYGNLTDRIGLLQQHGLIGSDDAQELSVNARFLRTLEHFVRLVTGRPDKRLPAGEHARAVIAKLMGTDSSGETGLAATLAVVLRRNREICLKYPF